MFKTLFKYFIELTGNPVASSLLKSFASSALSRPLIRPFAAVYGIDQNEMEYPIRHYKSLQAFFTRRLLPDSRPIDNQQHTLTSPVDGTVTSIGKISSDQMLHIKNQFYTTTDILGDANNAATYQGGYFIILYLSPSRYHRIHYPINGCLTVRYALGGISYPVNNLGMRLGDKPISTNYRIISELSTDFGRISMIKVGAWNINSVHLFHVSHHCKKGDEIGYFSFGSTVVLLVEKNARFTPTVKTNTEVSMGQTIGKWFW